MRVSTHRDMTDGWHSASETMLFSRRNEIDAVSGLTGVTYDHVLHCDSMAFDFDVGRDLWLTRHRFPKLQRDYLQKGSVGPFLDRCEAAHKSKRVKAGVITQLMCRLAVRSDGEEIHNWGNCMIAFTFRGGKRPTLALHSRVSYIAYLGSMDMALAWVIGREVARRIGLEVEELRFIWHVDSLQWHGFKCIPYVMSQSIDELFDEKAYPVGAYPLVHMTRRSILLLHRDWENGRTLERDRENGYIYGPARRMATRYRRVMSGNPMPSVPLASLTLLEEMR